LKTKLNGSIGSYNVAMRQRLDIFANVVACRSLPGVPLTRHRQPIDIAVIRENTEGEYSGLYSPSPSSSLYD
jgi:isocitrate dehydrogenase (NAD+)